MKLGTSYYPEDLDPEEWGRDLDNMRDAALTVLRIGEFAWSAMEPREGCYRFEWLDQFLDLAARKGFDVILCTPTATPPPWLTTQYPEMMVQLRDGLRRAPGGRRDADIENEIYRHYCVLIVTELAKRYGHHPAVIGWQIDNELIGPEGVPPEVHTPAVTFRFRQYLKQVHGSLDVLNDRWGTRFWSQEYSDWSQIPTPLNPRSTMGHVLDYSRYFSDSIKRFLILQRDTLRPWIASHHWISHNSTAVFDRGLDHADWAQELDVAGWDAYFGAAGGHRAEASAALAHDLFRSAKHKPFWVFETGSRFSDSSTAFWEQMHAHGAMGVILWHWRAHRANAEAGTDTICDHDGLPYADRVEWLRRMAANPQIVRPQPQTFCRQRAAILFCPDCVRTTLTPDPYIQRGRTRQIPYLQVLVDTYDCAREMGIRMDVVRPGQSLDGYELLLMPGAQLLAPDACAAVEAFVSNGGRLVAVAKTAHQDQWAKYYRTPHGPLASMLGAYVRRDVRTASTCQIHTFDDRTFECLPHIERVEQVTDDAKVLATFVDGPASTAPAAYTRPYGKGCLWYVAGLAEEAIEMSIRAAARACGLIETETSEAGPVPADSNAPPIRMTTP